MAKLPQVHKLPSTDLRALIAKRSGLSSTCIRAYFESSAEKTRLENRVTIARALEELDLKELIQTPPIEPPITPIPESYDERISKIEQFMPGVDENISRLFRNDRITEREIKELTEAVKRLQATAQRVCACGCGQQITGPKQKIFFDRTHAKATVRGLVDAGVLKLHPKKDESDPLPEHPSLDAEALRGWFGGSLSETIENSARQGHEETYEEDRREEDA